MNDFNGYFFHFVRTLSIITSKIIWSIYNYVKCFIFKINIGKKCRFYGNIALIRKYKSTISIGNSNTFRSARLSNLIGIKGKCIIATHQKGAKIFIGDNCGFSGTVIGAFCSITINNNVRCGANTLITDSDWHIGDPRTGEDKPVVLEDNVWLGEGVKVLKGVIIGKNSVIGAGSVVVKNIPANVIAAGNPCKVIRSI